MIHFKIIHKIEISLSVYLIGPFKTISKTKLIDQSKETNVFQDFQFNGLFWSFLNSRDQMLNIYNFWDLIGDSLFQGHRLIKQQEIMHTNIKKNIIRVFKVIITYQTRPIANGPMKIHNIDNDIFSGYHIWLRLKSKTIYIGMEVWCIT